MSEIWLNKTLFEELGDKPDQVLDNVASMQGETVRHVNIRRTFRTTIGNRSYFIKYHGGISAGDILGDLIRLRRPTIGARNEYLRTEQLTEIGLHTPKLAGFCEQGFGLINHRSCLITEDLGDTITVNELSVAWLKNPPTTVDKRALIKNLARTIGCIHRAGIVHRDLYLSHFRIKKQDLQNNDFNNIPLHVMDLHRALHWKKLSDRWLIKDLGALYFSSLDRNLTKRDIYRFLKIYFMENNLRVILSQHTPLLLAAEKKAQKIYLRHKRKQNRG